MDLRRRGGFTLIEILVVVVILAVLAAVVVPAVLGRIKDARVSAAITDISNFKTALDNYNLDTGQFPTTEQGLNALIVNPGVAKWNKPYLETGKIPTDPWGNQYIYKCPGEHGDYDIVSQGDGSPGSEIDSWNLKGQ
jgi:general secretion pathway protein G